MIRLFVPIVRLLAKIKLPVPNRFKILPSSGPLLTLIFIVLYMLLTICMEANLDYFITVFAMFLLLNNMTTENQLE